MVPPQQPLSLSKIAQEERKFWSSIHTYRYTYWRERARMCDKKHMHCVCHHQAKKKANSHIMLEKTALAYAKLADKSEQFSYY